jgi:hypothetical protein
MASVHTRLVPISQLTTVAIQRLTTMRVLSPFHQKQLVSQQPQTQIRLFACWLSLDWLACVSILHTQPPCWPNRKHYFPQFLYCCVMSLQTWTWHVPVLCVSAAVVTRPGSCGNEIRAIALQWPSLLKKLVWLSASIPQYTSTMVSVWMICNSHYNTSVHSCSSCPLTSTLFRLKANAKVLQKLHKSIKYLNLNSWDYNKVNPC